MDAVREHEMQLTGYALDALRDRFGDDLTIYGPPTSTMRGGVVSFLFDGIHAHDISPGARRGRASASAPATTAPSR